MSWELGIAFALGYSIALVAEHMATYDKKNFTEPLPLWLDLGVVLPVVLLLGLVFGPLVHLTTNICNYFITRKKRFDCPWIR